MKFDSKSLYLRSKPLLPAHLKELSATKGISEWRSQYHGISKHSRDMEQKVSNRVSIELHLARTRKWNSSPEETIRIRHSKWAPFLKWQDPQSLVQRRGLWFSLQSQQKGKFKIKSKTTATSFRRLVKENTTYNLTTWFLLLFVLLGSSFR